MSKKCEKGTVNYAFIEHFQDVLEGILRAAGSSGRYPEE
jgi:hypothetical protein